MWISCVVPCGIDGFILYMPKYYENVSVFFSAHIIHSKASYITLHMIQTPLRFRPSFRLCLSFIIHLCVFLPLASYLDVGFNERKEIVKSAYQTFPFETVDEYNQQLREIWDQPQHEFQHAAMLLAQKHKKFILPASLPLYEHFVRTGCCYGQRHSAQPHAPKDNGGILWIS